MRALVVISYASKALRVLAPPSPGLGRSGRAGAGRKARLERSKLAPWCARLCMSTWLAPTSRPRCSARARARARKTGLSRPLMSDVGVVWAWACGVPRVMTVGELAAVSVTLLPPGAWGLDLARACTQGGVMCEMLIAY